MRGEEVNTDDVLVIVLGGASGGKRGWCWLSFASLGVSSSTGVLEELARRRRRGWWVAVVDVWDGAVDDMVAVETL